MRNPLGILRGGYGLLLRGVKTSVRMGVTASMDPRQSKRIVLSNQISISIALMSLPYVLIYLFSDAGIMGWLEIPIFLGYASVHRLNKAGFTWFSRFWLITLANLDILTYTLSMGTSIGLHLFYLLAGSAPMVLFDWENRKSIAYGVGLSTLLFLGTEAFVPAVGLFDPVSPSHVRTLRLVEMFTMDLIQVLLIVYFFRGNRATEIALARAGEEAKAADDVKSRFLAKMSDEIRIPLNEILSRAHVLGKTGLLEERQGTLDDIQLSAQDLLTIVDEILDLSRIESGQMRLEQAPFSPLRLGHSVLRPFEFEAGRKNLSLTLEADPRLPAQLLGDAARIKQVMRNLIGNAFKFTESGRIVLRIRNGSAGGQPSSHILDFEIEDTGIGVPQESRDRIFEPFAQADASTTRKYGGTGLGLFISKQIVELMGGAIGLRSREGGGTVFHFNLPLPRVAEAQAANPSPAIRNTPGGGKANPVPGSADIHPGPVNRPVGPLGPPGPPSEKLPGRVPQLPAGAMGLSILVVDDHPLNRKVLESFLASYGLTARLVHSGEKALEACAETAYHVIFMDCHMPGMDGYECTRRMRKSQGKGSRPIIIGVTADAMESNLKKCLQAGMDALLIKPIMEKELRALLIDCATGIG